MPYLPNRRRCPNSGAMVFDLSDEEKALKKALEDVANVKQENEDLRERVERLEALLVNKEYGW